MRNRPRRRRTSRPGTSFPAGSAPARRGVWHERRSSAELHDRERECCRPDDPRRRSEIQERAARAVTIEQLRNVGHAEYRGEEQSTEEQEGCHLDQAASLATNRPPLPSQVAFRWRTATTWPGVTKRPTIDQTVREPVLLNALKRPSGLTANEIQFAGR